MEADKLASPIFTPAHKADTGHDENISFEEVENRLGKDLAKKLRDKSLELYDYAAKYALNKGIIIADTKFEFGLEDEKLILIDEVLTPDSSRFWPANKYKPGFSPPSLDKQYVRDYLEAINWNKKPPVPALPPEVAEVSKSKYLQIFELLTGSQLLGLE